MAPASGWTHRREALVGAGDGLDQGAGPDWRRLRAGRNPGGVEGPAVFANHHNNGGPDDEWYLFVDVIPSIGYRPMVSRDLDQGWVPLQADDYFLTAHTKHGGVASLTRAEYDRLAQHVHAF